MPTVEELKKDLFYKPKHAAELVSDEEIAKADEFCEGYKDFLAKGKT